jgi:hypothetical protein
MTEQPKPTRAQLIEMLNEMNDSIERLPPHALSSPTLNMDMSALLILLYAIFKAEN